MTVHDVLPTCELHIPLLQTDAGGIVSLDNLVQRDRELLPALLSVLPQLLDGRKDDYGILCSGVYVNHLGTLRLLQLSDPSLQVIILESMFSFLAKQRNRTHRPCSAP